MADSEGTFEIGVDNVAAMAATDFGGWSPVHGDSTDDLWANADGKLEPVALRALKRAALQLAALASGERQFSLGVMLDGGRMLKAQDSDPAYATINDVRIRRAIQVRCSYTLAANTKTYAALAEGSGQNGTNGVTTQVVLHGTSAVHLDKLYIYCVDNPGTTAIEIESAGGAIAAISAELAAGLNTIDFLTEAGVHEIGIGSPFAISLDPTSNHGTLYILAELREGDGTPPE